MNSTSISRLSFLVGPRTAAFTTLVGLGIALLLAFYAIPSQAAGTCPNGPSQVVQLPTGSHPKGIAFDPVNNRIWVALRDLNQVLPIDGATCATLPPVTVGAQPFGVTYVDGKVFVANFLDETVSVVNSTTMAKIGTINLSPYSETSHIAANPNTHRVYATLHKGGRVAVINSQTNALIKFLPVGRGAFGIAVATGVNRIYVGNRDSGSITVINGATNTVLSAQTINAGGSPYSLAAFPGNATLLASIAPPGAYPNRLRVYGLKTGSQSTLATFTVSNMEDGGMMAANPVTRHVFVAETAHNTVRVLQARATTPPSYTTFRVLGAGMGIGSQPLGVAVDTKWLRAFVGNRGSDTLTVICDDPASGCLTAATVTPTGTAVPPSLTPTPTSTPAPVPTTVSVPRPKGMVSDQPARHLFVASNTTNLVYVFDEESMSLNRTIGVGAEPFGVGMVDGKVYVANYAATNAGVSVINAGTLSKSKDIDLSSCGGQATHVGVNPNTHRAYVTLHASGRVAVVETVGDTLSACIDVSAGTFGVAVDPSSNSIYVGNRDGLDLWRIDGNTNAATQVINWSTGTGGGSPYYVGINPAARKLYVMVGTPDANVPNQLYAYNIDTSGNLTLWKNVATGNTDDGGYILPPACSTNLFIAQTFENTVVELKSDLTNFALHGSLEGIGLTPFGLAENPSLNRLYIGNKGSDTVSILQECAVPPTSTATPTSTSSPTRTFTSTFTKTPTRTFTKTFTPSPTRTFTPVPRPDLTITGMSISMNGYTGGCVLSYDALALRIDMRNIGNANAGAFGVSGNGVVQNVSGLPAGASMTLWFSNPIQGGNNTGIVDVNNQVTESNESNNTLTQLLAVPTAPAICTNTPTPTPTPIVQPNGMVSDVKLGHLFVNERGPGLVNVIDETTMKSIKGIPVGQQPYGIGLLESKRLVFTANYKSDSVSVISADSLSVITTIGTAPCAGGQPTHIAIDPVHEKVYVALHTNGRVMVIDASTSPPSLASCIDLNGAAGSFGIAYLAGTHSVYVTSRDSFDVRVIDTNTDTVLANQAYSFNGASPYFVAADPNASRLFVAVAEVGNNDLVTRLFVLNATAGGLAPATAGPLNMNDNADGGWIGVSACSGNIYITEPQYDPVNGIVHNGDVRVFDSNLNQVALYTVPGTGPDPYSLAFDSSRHSVFVGNRYGNSISTLAECP